MWPMPQAPTPRSKRRKFTAAERAAMKAALEEVRAQGGKVATPNRAVRNRDAAVKAKTTNRRGLPKGRKCHGLNLAGEPCGASPLSPGKEVEGTVVTGEWCLAHDPDVPEGSWKRFVQDPGTKALKSKGKIRRPLEIFGAAVDLAPALLFEAHLDSLGLVWDPDTGTLHRNPDPELAKGARIVGFSREGVARVSKHKDLGAQRQAEKELMDRVFGKPRQALEVAGGTGGMAVVQIPQTTERAHNVAKILVETGAVRVEVNGDDELAE